MHAGHVLMLQECRENCDYLVVGLQIDPSYDRIEKNRPVMSIVERQVLLAPYCDRIMVYHTEKDLMDILMITPIDVRFVGTEYQSVDFTGKQYCLDQGMEIYYNRRDHDWSTSELRERVYLDEQSKREKSQRRPKKSETVASEAGLYDFYGAVAGDGETT